jgi:hypothetical protein
MKKIVFIIFLSIYICGCQPIMMKMYGIKDPDIENEKTVVKKKLKYGLDTANIFTVSINDFLGVLNGQSIPDGAIYDRDGKYIEYRQTDTSCNAGLFKFISDLNLTNKYNQPEHLTFYQEFEKFRDLRGNYPNKIEPADFYLLVYWTIWTGKLNKNHVKTWEDLARKNNNCKIKVIKINLDIQKYWGEKECEKMVQAMSKNKKKN